MTSCRTGAGNIQDERGVSYSSRIKNTCSKRKQTNQIPAVMRICQRDHKSMKRVSNGQSWSNLIYIINKILVD